MKNDHAQQWFSFWYLLLLCDSGNEPLFCWLLKHSLLQQQDGCNSRGHQRIKLATFLLCITTFKIHLDRKAVRKNLIPQGPPIFPVKNPLWVTEKTFKSGWTRLKFNPRLTAEVLFGSWKLALVDPHVVSLPGIYLIWEDFTLVNSRNTILSIFVLMSFYCPSRYH